MSGPRSLTWRRRLALLVVLVLACVPAACGGDGGNSGAAKLTWYINPDNGGQATLAKKCTAASDGAYTIATQILPNEADAQREQLVRRLAADDSSVSLMSLDPPFVAEFANAGYLLEITDKADVRTLTDGVLDGPLETAYWEDKLVAAPFWANTQLLWFRKSVAEAAGVDPTAQDFTWEEMIKAAEAQKKKIGVQGRRYEGLMVWVNALVASGGGQILENEDKGADATPAIGSPAGEAAAKVIGTLARSSAAPSDLSTAGEEEARSLFQGADGSFMVNWGYVWGAANAAVDEGALEQSVVDDIGWARYPRVAADKASAPPLGGIDLAIGKFTKNPEEALAAAKCITSLESNAQYMVESGNPAARAAAFDDPEVKKAFPMAALIRDSLKDAAPRPITPYYGDVSVSVQRNWHPPASVTVKTPQKSATFMSEVLSGDRLL